MTFFDISPYNLSEGSQYFFNILVICISVSPDMAIFQDNIIGTWYLEEITSSRPTIYHIYVDDYASCDARIVSFPHCVVELKDNNEVSFFQMLDYDTDDDWRID